LSGGGEDGCLLERENEGLPAGFLLFFGFFVSRFDFCSPLPIVMLLCLRFNGF
jgi:hypothetical protein